VIWIAVKVFAKAATNLVLHNKEFRPALW